MNTTDPPEHIKCHRVRHAWYQERRTSIKHRLEHARRAAHHWPNSNRHRELVQLEQELEHLNRRAPESTNTL